MISYGGIFRHISQHTRSDFATDARQHQGGEIDDFVESMQQYRPVAITVNVDKEIRRVLFRKQRMFQKSLVRRGYRRRATMSSIVNFFLGKGAEGIRTDKAEADRAFTAFMKQTTAFKNARMKRVQGRPLSTMISNETFRNLMVDVQSAFSHSKPFEDLRRHLDEAIQGQLEVRDEWLRFRFPSFTDYVNLTLRAGLALWNKCIERVDLSEGFSRENNLRPVFGPFR
jgi:hypothetical protein